MVDILELKYEATNILIEGVPWELLKTKMTIWIFLFVIGMRQAAWNNHRTRPFWYINPKNSTGFVKFSSFQLFFIFYFENIRKYIKIIDWQKVQSCFPNISALKYPSKMVQYSKRTFGCQVSNETDPNNGNFLFFEKLNRNHGAIF